jgi:hypothetical protein
MIAKLAVLALVGSFVAVGCAASDVDASQDESPPEASEGAATYTASYTKRDGSLTEAALYPRSQDRSLGAEIDFLRPVLQGVLYRGGFSQGDADRSGLGGATKSFCEKGFSEARYIDFSKSSTPLGVTTCGGARSFDYEAGSTARPDEIMKSIHGIIKNNEGPMFVHGMWGVHSSGAIAAMALVQFCGWPEARAKAYWDKARNNANCAGGCDKWIDDKFSKFHFDPALTISDEEQSAICPH